MEVHAHSHTPRQKWTHYLWEFLMLFLAVFCGFLAENQREQIVEHKKEKEYMMSMLADLKTDTASIFNTYESFKFYISKMDSLIYLVNSGIKNDDALTKIYSLQLQTSSWAGISFEDRTSAQLKNAGGMRLIRDEAVSDSIRKYWKLSDLDEIITQRIRIIGDEANEMSTKIFYWKYFIGDEKFSDSTAERHAMPATIKGIKFIPDSEKLLTEYINLIIIKRIRSIIYVNKIKETAKTAINLINLIKKNYQLD